MFDCFYVGLQVENIITAGLLTSEIKEHFYHLRDFKVISLKGPLKYLLRPLLGKNQFAVTQRTYACIGPNLDNTY